MKPHGEGSCSEKKKALTVYALYTSCSSPPVKQTDIVLIPHGLLHISFPAIRVQGIFPEGATDARRLDAG
jgi:hypothetical protein